LLVGLAPRRYTGGSGHCTTHPARRPCAACRTPPRISTDPAWLSRL
jgi:hypothetical protein